MRVATVSPRIGVDAVGEASYLLTEYGALVVIAALFLLIVGISAYLRFKNEQARFEVQTAVQSVADPVIVLTEAEIFPEWADFVDTEIPQGKVIRHAGNLYRTRSQHLVLGHYPPGIDTARLYLMTVPPEEEEEEEGVTLPWEDRHAMQKELYKIGDIVTHNGYYWTSKIDNNTHEPSDAAYAAWEKGDPLP